MNQKGHHYESRRAGTAAFSSHRRREFHATNSAEANRTDGRGREFQEALGQTGQASDTATETSLRNRLSIGQSHEFVQVVMSSWQEIR